MRFFGAPTNIFGNQGKDSKNLSTPTSDTKNPRYLIIHEVFCDGSSPAHSRHPETAYYLDEPRLFQGDLISSLLRGRMTAHKERLQAQNDPDISFIIYRCYNCTEYHSDLREHLQKLTRESEKYYDIRPQAFPDVQILAENAEFASPDKEYMVVNSHEMKAALKEIQSLGSPNGQTLSGWDREPSMIAPYLHFYHLRGHLKDFSTYISNTRRGHVSLLLDYLDDEFGAEYREAKELFAQGFVNRKHFDKLFGPKELLVLTKNGHSIAIQSKYIPLPGSDPIMLDCDEWTFDGDFTKFQKRVIIPWPKNRDEDESISIQSLPIFPLRFDRNGVEEKLRTRGQMFWRCRKQHFVSYLAPSTLPQHKSWTGRYMIDTGTFRQLYGWKYDDEHDESKGERLSKEIEDSNSDVLESLLVMLPATLFGFGFHDKQWRELEVENLSEIDWNKRAFHYLVLPVEQKYLLQGLVTTHSENAELTESSETRGTGVAILFTGAPGTGKTFAAEALSEIAQRPLYSLAIGDIGIDLDKVKKSLESAFHLGSLWGAVMLIEESDVLLEGRSLSDMGRNAIVATVLRSIELYQGIVILTSNRFGTLDEALRSHIRLSVLFESSESGRRDLWKSLIDMILVEQNRNKELSVNFEGLKRSILKLCKYDLTGRQISKAIQNAKQLAIYKGQMLDESHIMNFMPSAKTHEAYRLKPT